MTDEEFFRIYRLLKDGYGIDMERKKEIIQGRLENYIVTNGFGDFSQYMNAVEMDFTGNVVTCGLSHPSLSRLDIKAPAA